jgi:hypothetical protein
MNQITYQHLLAEYRSDIEKQLEALVKVAKRVGVPAPTWTFSSEYEYEFTVELERAYGDSDGEYETYIEKVFDITFSVEQSIKMAGDWKVVACINHEEGVISQIDVDIELPTRFSPKIDKCDHCGKSFPRVKSFVIVNEKGEFRQLGKSCMRQFLGVNPVSYISMFEAVSKFSNYVIGLGYAKNHKGSQRLSNLAYNVSDIIRLIIGQVARDGQFVKAEWETVEEEYTARGRWGRTYSDTRTRNVRTNKGEATIDKVKDMLDAVSYYRTQPTALEFASTLPPVLFFERHVAKWDLIQQSLHTAYEAIYSAHKPAAQIGQDLTAIDKEISNIAEVIKARNKSQKAYSIYDTLRDQYYTKLRFEAYQNAQADFQISEEAVTEVKDWAAALEVKMVEDDDIDWEKNFETGEVTVTYRYATGFDKYKDGIKTMFSKERTLQSNLKHFCSGYNTFLTDMEKRRAKAGQPESQYVGVVGEKTHLVLTVEGMRSGVGSYGTWYLWTLVDASGNKFKKFGSLDEKHVIQKPEVLREHQPIIGCTIEALFDIKKHEQFGGEKITELGRASKVKKAKYITL